MLVLAFLSSELVGVGVCCWLLVGGDGTSPSRLITANEQTPCRIVAPPRAISNIHYHSGVNLHSLEYNVLGADFGGGRLPSCLQPHPAHLHPLVRTMFTLGMH